MAVVTAMVNVPPYLGTSVLGGTGFVCGGSTTGGGVVGGVVVGGVVTGGVVVGGVVVGGVAAGAQAAITRDNAIKVLTTSQRILFLISSSFFYLLD